MPSKQAADATPSVDTDTTRGAADIAALQDQSLRMMSQFGLAWVEGVSDLGSEVLSFVADQIKEDVKAQHAMLHCKDVTELQRIQAQFIQKAVDQYTAETGKLVQMSQDLYSPPSSREDQQS